MTAADGHRQVGLREQHDELSEATRFMCAGAYIDEKFVNQVVKELFGQTMRAVAPSYGFDLRTVALHCLAVRHRNRTRDALLVAVTALILLVWSPLSLSGVGWAWWVLWASVGLLYIIVLSSLFMRRREVRHLRRVGFQARPQPQVPMAGRLRRRLDAITAAQDGNVTIYSGFDPFMGAGQPLPGWSFAIPLVAAPGRDDAVERFSVAELVAHVRLAIDSIATSDGLRGLTVGDRVFVHLFAMDRRFLPNPAAAPQTHLDAAEVERITAEPYGAARHYCSVHVRSWGGEVVTSLFFHFSTEGDKLYFECVKRVLSPIRREYHRIDGLRGELSFGDFLGLAVEAWVRTIPDVVAAPFRLLGDVGGDPAQHGPVVHHGASFSVRELIAQRAWPRSALGCHGYFQELDVDKHLKIVERHALGAILEFLAAHGIDTSEFDSRKSTILDQSVTVVGSVVGAVATGKEASATQSGTIGVTKEAR